MNRATKTAGSILALGTLLVAFNLGGSAGCGSSGTGSGSTAQTTTQQQAGTLQVINGLASLSAIGANGGTPGALIARSEQAGLKSATTTCTTSGSTTTCNCDIAGTFLISTASQTSVDMTFNSCDFGDGVIDGRVNFSFVLSGSAIDSFTMTFNAFSYEITDCGTYTVSGTITGNVSGSDVNLAFDISTTHNGTTSTITADLTANADQTISGNLSTTNPTITCDFGTSPDSTPFTCAGIAAACGVTAADVCDSNGNFDNTVCQ